MLNLLGWIFGVVIVLFILAVIWGRWFIYKYPVQPGETRASYKARLHRMIDKAFE